MRMVRFGNGKYGIQRRFCFFWKEYRALTGHAFWWNVNANSFPSCQGTFEQVMELYSSMKIDKDITKVIEQ